MKRLSVAVPALVLLLAACSRTPSPTPQQQAAQRRAQVEAQAQSKLSMYKRLLQLKNYPLAVPIGQEIEQNYPHTKAAAEVRKSLPGIQAKAKAQSEKRRLTDMWTYQVAPMEGGTQSTATIESNPPTGPGQVQLVLRRHSKWGQSIYLYAQDKGGFVCKGQCDIVMHVDGKRHVIKGYRPNGGEPALFITKDKAFLHTLEHAKKITMDVTLKNQGKETLVYEVGGFDPSQWKSVKKGK